ncbi:tetratricopeptide repeat protein [Paraburkholderia guartelaensis]|uniref:tetratricopeptide repeat protein n=1 Tax=Paraburkholderia guartelaensis TaxID=2546446 RepID=UPI002AB73158|nr:tetratricopeptide repeat protein [Paraburkholderia guartelaensis]
MTRGGARRDFGTLLFVALAGLPATAMAMALPGASLHADPTVLLSGTVNSRMAFENPTTPCALVFDYRYWSASPLDKPKDERARCRNEAAQGNLSARAIYGQMVTYGYGGQRDTDRGVVILKSAALDGSLLARRILGNVYRDGTAVPQDYLEARQWFASAAVQGDAISADVLGAMSANGEGQPVDNAVAYRYFVQAAEGGSANGAANAAQFAAFGRGVPKDPQLAASWMIRGARGGDAGAQFLLGFALLRGEGVPRDAENGVAWLRESVRQGNTAAVAVLGDAYLGGVGVQRDDRRGFVLMSQAAARGSIYAQRRVGDLYVTGTGVAKNDVAARAWYRKASLESDATARAALSNLYRTGRGGPVDLEAAISWMRGAADAGLATAQNDLGVMYREGWGTHKDSAEARKWFERARAQGLGVASLNLAVYPLRGEGEPVDFAKAFKLASEGAERGSDAAAITAAAMAWQGQGTHVDKALALRWYRFAADRGNVEAARWIGNQYLTGTAVPRDESLGLHYLTLATNAGDSASSVSLGAYLTEHHQSLAGKTGVEWLEAAAQRRVPAAYAALGYTYARGVAGKPDAGVAVNWFSQGAQLGDSVSQAWLCSAYAYGSPGVQRRPDYAARWCQAASRSGNVIAMRVLADEGNGIANDTSRVYWQWRVANQGDPKYQSMLGDSYDLGDGVAPDLSAATYWFRRAAEQGNASAQASLAWHLFTGLGGRVDAYEAFTWASKAAPADSEAKRMMGVAYAYGRGVGRDPDVGRAWLEKAMAAGNDWAASDLATLYEIGPLAMRDSTRAMQLHRQGARDGAEQSQIALALHALASGAEAGLGDNERRWLIPADAASNLWSNDALAPSGELRQRWDGLSCLNEALLGNPLMQYDIGMRFLTGNGVPRDRALGAAWIARARAGFEARAGVPAYAAAIRIVESRLSERMGDDEKQRAREVAANLGATVTELR